MTRPRLPTISPRSVRAWRSCALSTRRGKPPKASYSEPGRPTASETCAGAEDQHGAETGLPICIRKTARSRQALVGSRRVGRVTTPLRLGYHGRWGSRRRPRSKSFEHSSKGVGGEIEKGDRLALVVRDRHRSGQVFRHRVGHRDFAVLDPSRSSTPSCPDTRFNTSRAPITNTPISASACSGMRWRTERAKATRRCWWSVSAIRSVCAAPASP